MCYLENGIILLKKKGFKLRIKILETDYTPTNIAVASARSRYVGKSIVEPEKVENWNKKMSYWILFLKQDIIQLCNIIILLF